MNPSNVISAIREILEEETDAAGSSLAHSVNRPDLADHSAASRVWDEHRGMMVCAPTLPSMAGDHGRGRWPGRADHGAAEWIRGRPGGSADPCAQASQQATHGGRTIGQRRGHLLAQRECRRVRCLPPTIKDASAEFRPEGGGGSSGPDGFPIWRIFR